MLRLSSLTSVVIVGGAVAVAGFAGPGPTPDFGLNFRSAEVALVVSPSFVQTDAPAFEECPLACDLECGTPENHATETAEKGVIKNPHSFCMALPNCNGQPTCTASRLPNGDDARLKTLVREVADGSEVAVQVLMAEFGDIALYNAERKALQLFGCVAGAVTALLPLQSGQIRAAMTAN
jgi:hypothetical protein